MSIYDFYDLRHLLGARFLWHTKQSTRDWVIGVTADSLRWMELKSILLACASKS